MIKIRSLYEKSIKRYDGRRLFICEKKSKISYWSLIRRSKWWQYWDLEIVWNCLTVDQSWIDKFYFVRLKIKKTYIICRGEELGQSLLRLLPFLKKHLKSLNGCAAYKQSLHRLKVFILKREVFYTLKKWPKIFNYREPGLFKLEKILLSDYVPSFKRIRTRPLVKNEYTAYNKPYLSNYFKNTTLLREFLLKTKYVYDLILEIEPIRFLYHTNTKKRWGDTTIFNKTDLLGMFTDGDALPVSSPKLTNHSDKSLENRYIDGSTYDDYGCEEDIYSLAGCGINLIIDESNYVYSNKIYEMEDNLRNEFFVMSEVLSVSEDSEIEELPVRDIIGFLKCSPKDCIGIRKVQYINGDIINYSLPSISLCNPCYLPMHCRFCPKRGPECYPD